MTQDSSAQISKQPSEQPPQPPKTADYIHLLLALLGKLPLLWLQLFASLIAWVLVLHKKNGLYKTTHRNLLIAFPEWDEKHRQHMTALALKAQLQSMLEFVKCWSSPPQYSVERIKQVTGQHLLHDAIARQKGLILIVPHFGTWEIMNAWINQFTDIVVMYKPDNHPALNKFVLQARSRLRATLVPADESGVRQLFKALKRGGVTAILPDHTPEASGGIYSDFFGCRLLTSTLVSRLAQKTQCEVLQLSCQRMADDPHYFQVNVETVDTAIRSDSLQASVDCMNTSIENLIRRHPQHYHWNYKRFKANPLLGDIYYEDADKLAPRIQQANQQNAQAKQDR